VPVDPQRRHGLDGPVEHEPERPPRDELEVKMMTLLKLDGRVAAEVGEKEQKKEPQSEASRAGHQHSHARDHDAPADSRSKQRFPDSVQGRMPSKHRRVPPEKWQLDDQQDRRICAGDEIGGKRQHDVAQVTAADHVIFVRAELRTCHFLLRAARVAINRLGDVEVRVRVAEVVRRRSVMEVLVERRLKPEQRNVPLAAALFRTPEMTPASSRQGSSPGTAAWPPP